jgi:aminoglycoside phosphotransferase (APT) family kinase protein
MSDDQDHTTPTPWRRDTAGLDERLAAWVRAVVDPDAVVERVSMPDGNGMSSETVLFDVRRGDLVESYVARLAPLPDVFPVFPEYDLALQAQVMRLVGSHTDVPVPTVAWHETDPSWVGSPFLVMHRIDGRPLPDMPPYVFGGWFMEAPAADQRRLEQECARVLAGVHRLTPATHDLGFLDRPAFGAMGLEQHLGYQRWYYEWARDGVHYPIVERTLDWLDEHRPPDGPLVLLWGDARPGNILFDGIRPVGVLDWEMAAVGPAEIDVAWTIFLHAFFQDLAVKYGFPGLADLFRRERFVADYEAAGGRTVEHLEWFEVFAAARYAIVSLRTLGRNVHYGLQPPPDDPDELTFVPHLLARMLDGSYWTAG